MVEELLNDPLVIGGVAATMLLVFLYKKRQQTKTTQDINPETMGDRLKKIFIDPTKDQGGGVKDWVKIKATSNTPRLMGLAIRAKDHTVTSLELTDPDKGKYTEIEKKGTSYGIIKGSKKIKVYPKYLMLKLTPGSLMYDKLVRTYDAPSSHIIPGDNCIWFTPNTHFVKYNGLYRVVTPEGMNRVWELSFSKLHENYLESKQAIPEQYATLNNRISGQLKMENIKSENIRKYMESENLNEKRKAMKD